MGRHCDMQQKPPRRKPGRKPVGPRKSTGVYLPLDVRAVAENQAAREGIALSPFLTRLICDGLELEAPSYCYPKTQTQEELPLSEAS